MLGKWVLIVAFAFYQMSADASASSLGRIVGGTDVPTPNFVVSVQYYGKHICGGIIYKKDFVITAAQCLDGLQENAITIRQNTTNHKKGGNIRYISEVHIHPNFDLDLKSNDIAIIKVQELVEASTVVTLLARNITTEAATLQIYGWGTKGEDEEELSSSLKKADVNIYDKAKCTAELGSLSVNENMICTSIGIGGQNACMGDEGGPLIKTVAKVNDLYGIISWNRKCNKGPMVYTFIFGYLNWIKEITEPNGTVV